MAFGTSRNFAALCLVPPSNIAGQLALYKRRLFESHGLVSALLWPEMAIVALGSTDAAGGLSLKELWEGIPGKFRSGEIKSEADGFYLELRGAFPELSAKAAISLGVKAGGAPFTAGCGFFLCGREGDGAFEGLEFPPPPTLSFYASDLALYRISLPEVCPARQDFAPFPPQALSWTRLRLAHRPRTESESL